MFKSVNPYNNEVIAEFEIEKNVEQRINIGHQAFKNWKTTTLAERSQLVEKFAQILEEKTPEFARIISLEMGKILKESVAEITKCVVTTRYYLDHTEEYLQTQILKTRFSKSFYAFEPTGVILSIMPWNFPFWQALRFAIPNILLGNTVILKHATNVLWSAQNLENLFREAGFPEGVFQNVIVDIPEVEKIIAHPCVKGVTLTGSGRAGSSVASLAGKYLKKSVLELGGSDPFVVLKDADIQAAAQMAAKSRFQNSGQTCIAAKRWIIETSVYEEFKDAVLEICKSRIIGDQFADETTNGPIARFDLAENLENQYNYLLNLGAKPTGEWQRENCLIQPQILEIDAQASSLFTDELFGPIGLLIKATNENQAIEIANDTSFGLGASLWTKDQEKAEKLMVQLNAGSVYVNNMVKSEGAIPFGGTNNSGYGRELGIYGMHEFANIKSYALNI